MPKPLSRAQVPKQFAAISELGAPLSVYRPQKYAAAILGAAFVLGGVALPWYVWEGASADRFELRSLAYLLPFVLGVAGLGSAYGNWRKAAVVYQGGLAYSDNEGARSVRWDEITEMTSEVTKHYRNGMYVGTTHCHRLIAHGFHWAILTKNDFPQVATLVEQIGQGIFPHLHRASANAWRAGHWVTFGPVSVHQSDGVRLQGELYPWSALESFSVKKGYLHLVQRDASLWSRMAGKGRIEISAIPNFPVLMAIVDQTVSVHVSQAD